MKFDFTVNLSTVMQVPILMGLLYVIRLINILKEYPPHRHINGQVIYPKGYAPEKAQGMAAGSGQ